jgi:glycine cleavage system H protein
MTTIDKYNFPDELYYTEEHVWVKMEGNIAAIGMSQFGQEIAGDILFVEAPTPGRVITKGEAFMSMESGKWVGRVKAPLSGKILEANSELEWESGAVNSDPYGKGWLTKIEVNKLDELKDLLRADSPKFAEFIAAERTKYKKQA